MIKNVKINKDYNIKEHCIDLFEVWNDTVFKCKHKNYQIPPSILYEDIKVYNLPLYTETKIIIEERDSIDCALELKLSGFNPVLLNDANINKPGGKGPESGSLEQEEYCFYRSNYHLHLQKNLYPLKKKASILSKDVEYFKTKKFHSIKEPIKIDMIAAAALKQPKLDNGKYKNDRDLKLMKNKIDMIFQIAYANQNDSIVLPAFGCNSYRNPPKVVANMFKEIIALYRGRFKIIYFAILDENFEVFSDTLGE